ncbi:hypothetical protein ABBQ38_010232 [Trebouxia sp. C0009 RCD-2024]
METWAEVPVAVLRTIASLLNVDSMQQARLVCRAWKEPASLAVHTLRPRITGSLGLQWHNLPLLSKAFPACRVLDLRSYKVPQDSGQHLKNTAFTHIHLSNVEAGPDHKRAFQDLHDYIACASSHKPCLHFEVDIHMIHQYGLLGSTDELFTDELCLKLLQFPESACITKLNVGSMPVPITGRGLAIIAHLTALTELTLICHQDIDDVHLELLSSLTNLTELKIGPLKHCSSEGLMNALPCLGHLQKLSMTDAVGVSDDCLAHVSAALSGNLQALSLANCPQLTDECIPCLAMPHLSSLFFSNNAQISLQGVEDLIAQSTVLQDLDFRGCACLTVRDRMKVQQRMLARVYTRQFNTYDHF